MTRNPTGLPTGRPYIEAYDDVSKECPQCGRAFYLREQKMQSLGRFQKRKYCSRACAEKSKGPVPGSADAFWARIKIGSQDECWEWQRRVSHNGYGLLKFGGRYLRAHRIAHEIAKGPIPDGMMVLHSCDNRKCCNPNHLRIGTAKDNMSDCIKRGRHPRNSNNSSIDYEGIRQASGTASEIAKRFSVSASYAWKIRNSVNQRAGRA